MADSPPFPSTNQAMTELPPASPNGTGPKLLEDATFEGLAAALNARIARDRELAAKSLAEVAVAEKRLQEKQAVLEEMQQRIFGIADTADDVVELNVGGQPMSTTRAVLCSAEGSLLAGMFSGNFDAGHKRDKDNRIFLDVDRPVETCSQHRSSI